MTTRLQPLKPTPSNTPERIPKANVDIRWPGMRQGFQYIVDTPGKGWREAGSRQRGGSFNPRGPTDPAQVRGFIPLSPTTAYTAETVSRGTPQNLQAPRPFTEVSPFPALDLKHLRQDYHAYTTDKASSTLAVGSTGSSPSKFVTAPAAWDPHFERIGALGSATAFQDAPPSMAQFPGTLVADHLTPEEFKTLAITVNPGDKGTLVIHGFGLGVLAKVGVIRDYWADRFLQEGLEVDGITNRGLNDFVITWRAKQTTASAGQASMGAVIVIGVIIVAVLLVLGWLGNRISMSLERGVGGTLQAAGFAILMGAVGLALLARASRRKIL